MAKKASATLSASYNDHDTITTTSTAAAQQASSPHKALTKPASSEGPEEFKLAGAPPERVAVALRADSVSEGRRDVVRAMFEVAWWPMLGAFSQVCGVGGSITMYGVRRRRSLLHAPWMFGAQIY